MLQAPAPIKFRQSDIRRAIGAVAGMGFEEVRVAIRLDGSLEVTVRRNALDDTLGEELD
ncbi:hypothetical protein [Novosphingobium sp. SG720]|uniref:hypothetical protein n=1 Tax=Novosphingobium sp. SG720 TaxID=2586998 RepID=UPI0014453BC1|nr:hypothetical protein [Novosphingobium sp. SG720]NKJ40793.1 hypothetical protein [Novosphingobium sp. SG720]